MPNNYKNGAAFERRVKRLLENDGYFVVRSGGSRGPIDLVAMQEGFDNLVVQCKAMPKAEVGQHDIAILKAAARKAGAHGLLAWRERGNNKMHLEKI